jgi:hypothetical protein
LGLVERIALSAQHAVWVEHLVHGREGIGVAAAERRTAAGLAAAAIHRQTGALATE